ncbi:helix-turn-helix domain-containing protein [Sulfurisphaera ohwakuensis]|uniref:helix-turn-helix domain-containing protein n=1 Tax=Sulfurisphaera ohwakuensis TaxID=69656 RepID=UPI0036F3A2F7
MHKIPLDVTILFENHPCEIMKIISSTGLKANVENIRLGKQTIDYILCFDKDIEKSDILKLKSSNVKVLRLSESRVWIRTNSCIVCKILYTSDVVTEKVKLIKNKTLLYTLFVPNKSSLNQFLFNLIQNGIRVTVTNITEVSNIGLTERQMEILKLAYKLGYFEDERRITLSQLADKLGISAPTLEQTLRKALRKIVKYYIDEYE